MSAAKGKAKPKEAYQKWRIIEKLAENQIGGESYTAAERKLPISSSAKAVSAKAAAYAAARQK